MKLFAILSLLVLQPLAVMACDGYIHCHCTNADGTPHDAATTTVCNRYASADANMIDANQYSAGAKECHYQGPEKIFYAKSFHYYAFENCDWRNMCNAAGGAGDSNCRDKPPVGPGSSNPGNIYAKHN